jgi:hypothetical protein
MKMPYHKPQKDVLPSSLCALAPKREFQRCVGKIPSRELTILKELFLRGFEKRIDFGSLSSPKLLLAD